MVVMVGGGEGDSTGKLVETRRLFGQICEFT